MCALEEIIVDYLGDDYSSNVTNDGTPQRDALIWLSDFDPLQLAVDSSITDDDDLLYKLITRFALAVFYEANIKGSGWSTSNNWRAESGTSTCQFTGVTCSDGEHISRLELSKSNHGANGAVLSHWCVQSSNTTMLT
jgi:hypothetical protein